MIYTTLLRRPVQIDAKGVYFVDNPDDPSMNGLFVKPTNEGMAQLLGASSKYTVTGAGSNLENGKELLSIYDSAKAGSQFPTLIVNPGTYDLGSESLWLDKYCNVVSATGEADVFIVNNTSNPVNILTSHCIFKGINCPTGVIGVDNNAKFNKIINCVSGTDGSFTDISSGSDKYNYNDYIGCIGKNNSFCYAPNGIAYNYGTFINCEGENNCFCYSGSGSVYDYGYYENCTGKQNCFASPTDNAPAKSSVYRECTGGAGSWGNVIQGSLINCILTSGTFPNVIGGNIYDSIDASNDIFTILSEVSDYYYSNTVL